MKHEFEMTIFPTISLSAVFLIISHFHGGHGITAKDRKTIKSEKEIEVSIMEKMEKEILGKLQIAYGFSWPEKMRLEEMISAINSRPLDKSKYLYKLRGLVSYLYHLKRNSAHPHLVQHFMSKTKILEFF